MLETIAIETQQSIQICAVFLQLKERRVELAFEDHRFYDVRRWKILDQTDKFVTGMKITKNDDGSFNYQRIKLADRNCSDSKYYLFPINQSEVNKMLQHTGISWQNPGW